MFSTSLTCVLIQGTVRCSPVVRFLAQMNTAAALLWGGDYGFPSPHLSVSGQAGGGSSFPRMHQYSHCLKPSGIPITYWVTTLQLGIQSFPCSSLCSLAWHSYSDFPEGHMAHPIHTASLVAFTPIHAPLPRPHSTFPSNWAIFSPLSLSSPQNSI